MATKKSLLLILSLCCVLCFSIISAQADQTFTFWPEQDTWVNESNPITNYGNNTYLNVKDRSGLAETYLKFSDNDIALLTGLPIASASLYLYQYQYNYSPGDTINLHKITSGWNENTITWNTKPASEAQNNGALTLAGDNNIWREWGGLQDMVKSWQEVSNYGLMLENNADMKNEELFARFYSSEYSNANNRPYLRVTAAPEPVSTTLFLLGGGALGFAMRKKKK